MAVFKKSTIKDVANRAGVSITTVSVFVAGKESVCSAETGARIRKAIAELHYTPNILTRGLRSGSTATIGASMASPLDPRLRFGSFFLEHLWRGILQEADISNYAVIHYPRSIRDNKDHKPYLDGRVDGLVMEANDHGRAPKLANAGMPTVLLARELNIPDGCGAVWTDENETMTLALDYLFDLGHRRIAIVTGPVGPEPKGAIWREPNGKDWLLGYVAIRRYAVYATWMRDHGLYDPLLVANANAWTAPNASKFTSLWHALPDPPTAIICANDAQAVGVCAAAQNMGWCVPGELSVVGIDNSPQARDCDPPLTSIEVRVDGLGKEAVRALLELMRGTPAARCRIQVLGAKLVIRNSTGPPNG